METGAFADAHHRRTAIRAVCGAGTGNHSWRVPAVRTGDDGGLDGSRSGSVGARRSGVRRHAARRRIPRRHLRRGSAAGAVRDECVRRSARDVRAVVCTRCSNVCKRGVYIRVSAARRRADRTGGADIPARAGHHVRRVLDVRRGLCTAARRKRLAQTGNAFGADRDRAFIAFGYQSVRRVRSRESRCAAARAGGGVSRRTGGGRGSRCRVRRGNGSQHRLRSLVHLLLWPVCARCRTVS